MDIESEHRSKHKIKRVKKINKFVGDGIVVKKQKSNQMQLSEIDNIINNNIENNTQTLLLGDGRTSFFVTEDSRKYLSSYQLYKKDNEYDYVDPRGYFDSVHNRYVKTYSAGQLQQKRIIAEFRNPLDIAVNFRNALKLDLSPLRMWQVSLAGAVLFGMISMSMIYKNLGQSAMAKGADGMVAQGDKLAPLVVENAEPFDGNEKVEEKKQSLASITDGNEKIEEKKSEEKVVEAVKPIIEDQEKIEAQNTKKIDSIVKKETVQQKDIKEEKIEKVDKVKKSVDGIVKKEVKEKEQEVNEPKYSLEYEAYEMVDGFPIEKMLPYILKQDPEVAKYMIAMAKQESAWGKRVPVLNGQDCYNYWGFRSKRKLMGSGGHTCFNSREDAVETVGRRIHELIYEYDRKTADRLIVWKCGSSCAGHSQDGVDRWIGTVGNYYDALSEKK